MSEIYDVNSKTSICELLNCYYTFINRFSGYIIRDEAQMKIILQRHLINDRAGILVAKEDGIVVGYTLYSRSNKGIRAEEVVYKSKRVFAAIANYLRDDKYIVKMAVPSHDKLYLYMNDPLGYVKCEPHTMGMILDITKSLSGLELMGQTEPIYAKITNISTHKSTEVFRIDEQGIAKVKGADYYDIECDMSTYTQLLWGFIGCKFAIDNGSLKVYNNERFHLFESIIKDKRTYVFEMF